ncbi:MAG: hypothetical protein HW416_2273 [Chloroflexi bacterium]|nr:hypothetical protein [Chloroflexota bacterium]
MGDGAPPEFVRYPQIEEPGVLEVRGVVWPCNFFQHMENDPFHGAFVHRRAGMPRGVFNIRRSTFEESSWGYNSRSAWSDGEGHVSFHGMPNLNYLHAPFDEDVPWIERFAWAVPIDDVNFLQMQIRLARVTGDAAERYRQRLARREERQAAAPPAPELAAKILRGEMHVDELHEIQNVNPTWAQDLVSQTGQGRLSNRSGEHLGRTDLGMILLRRLWSRELHALAEGGSLTNCASLVKGTSPTAQLLLLRHHLARDVEESITQVQMARIDARRVRQTPSCARNVAPGATRPGPPTSCVWSCVP